MLKQQVVLRGLYINEQPMVRARLSRFADRAELSFDDLWREYFQGTDVLPECAQEALQLLADIYEIPVGKMRPQDALSKFFDDPPKSNSMLKSFLDSVTSTMYEIDIEDILEEKMKKNGTWKFWKKKFNWEFEKFTIIEFIQAYCGQRPEK